jgi:hypothetical protein
MTIPSILYGFLFATLYGSLFHLWRGGRFGRYVLFVLLSWMGFWIGQIIAELSGWTFLSIGAIHLGMATLGSILFLFVGSWLSIVKSEKSQK